MIRRYYFKFVTFCMCVYIPVVACAASITLQWDSVTTDEDGAPISNLAGYHLFQSTSSLLGKTTQQAMVDPSISKMAILSPEISTVTSVSYSVSDLTEGATYFFRLTAYNTLGNQSGFNVDYNGTDEEVVVFILPLGVPDTTPPIISNISSSSITSSSAAITWITNEPATSLVEYGLTTYYGSSTTLNNSLVTNYSFTLTGLAANTTYHYRVKSKDASGNETISGDYSFTTYKETTNYDPITQGQNWKYFKGINDPGFNWMALNYDDLGWLQGPTGIGYGDGDDATVLSDMQYNYVTVYMRKPFSLGNIGTVTDLVLSVNYDDGFVAYINGTEVARTTNITGAPDRNTLASPDHEAGTPEVFNIGSYINLLKADNNILAIEVHNTSIDSSDLSMIPKLTITGIQKTPDTTPPIGSVSINNGVAKTNTTSVNLTLSAIDTGSGMGQGAQMQFSNDNVIWSTPESYTTTKNWILTSGNGTKTVYVKFKDVTGNWSNEVSDTIKLDVPPSRPRRLRRSI